MSQLQALFDQTICSAQSAVRLYFEPLALFRPWSERIRNLLLRIGIDTLKILARHALIGAIVSVLLVVGGLGIFIGSAEDIVNVLQGIGLFLILIGVFWLGVNFAFYLSYLGIPEQWSKKHRGQGRP